MHAVLGGAHRPAGRAREAGAADRRGDRQGLRRAAARGGRGAAADELEGGTRGAASRRVHPRAGDLSGGRVRLQASADAGGGARQSAAGAPARTCTPRWRGRIEQQHAGASRRTRARCWRTTGRRPARRWHAARWHRRAAEWAGITNAAEGVRHWERVRSLVRTLPHTSETSQLGVTACLGISLSAGASERRPTEAAGIFEEGRRLAEERRRRADAGSFERCPMRACSAWSGATRTSTCATAARQRDWLTRPRITVCSSPNAAFLAFACLFAGRLLEGIEVCDTAFRRLPAEPALGAEFTGYSPFLGILLRRRGCSAGSGVSTKPRRCASERSIWRGYTADSEVLTWVQRHASRWTSSSPTRPPPAATPAMRWRRAKNRPPRKHDCRTPCAGNRTSAQLPVG